MADAKKPFHEVVAERVIDQLERGVAPWQRPWEPGNPSSRSPHNAITGKRYKGINSIYLQMQGRADQRWLTYNQAKSVGAQVRKGEKGTTCQKWIFTREEIKRDNQGKPILDAQGKPQKHEVRLERPILSMFTVFNAEQVDGLPAIEKRDLTWDVSKRAEAILTASGASISHAEGDAAYYHPARDEIRLPDKSQFPTPDNYYATAFHELGHWTGHASRLDRDLAHPFGSEGYAREELRAEIASMITGDELGLGHDPGQHAAYVKSWVKALKEDPLEIFRAAADAEKIHNFVMAFEQTQQQELDEQAVIAPEGITTVQDDTQQVGSTEHQVPAEAGERVFLDVPFKEKEDAKALGAVWDRQERAWCVPAGVDLAQFDRWPRRETAAEPLVQAETESEMPALQKEPARQYLAVPFGERDLAKLAGAKWDRVAKSWYAGPDADQARVARWATDSTAAQQMPAMDPREEFIEALQSMGCVVDGIKHPIMDGKRHRIALSSDKGIEESGVYIGHLDGHPAGYIKNHRTQVEMKWKSKGYSLDPVEKARLQAEAAQKMQDRAAQLVADQEAARSRVEKQLTKAVPALTPTPYLASKGLAPSAGVFTDKEGTTFLPAYDANGRVWTMQYIKTDGVKRFAKDGKKEGCFHVVGGLEAIKDAPALVIAEGYATAGTCSSALGFATVAAFDAGNLPAVVLALQEKYPEKPVIIVGDDDLATLKKEGINPGRKKAIQAARDAGGEAVFPIFAPGEQSADNKDFTDFNDLANKSALGMDGVRRQLKPVVQRAVETQAQTRAAAHKVVRVDESIIKRGRTA